MSGWKRNPNVSTRRIVLVVAASCVVMGAARLVFSSWLVVDAVALAALLVAITLLIHWDRQDPGPDSAPPAP